MDLNRKYSAYNNMQTDGPWHIVILDRIWWNENFENISIWFSRNYSEFKPEKDTVYFKLPTTNQYTMWQMSWN